MWQALVRLPKGRLHGPYPGCCQCTHLAFFHDIHDVAYSGGSQDQGDPSSKVGQIQDYQGYLILIIALDFIYLNLDDNRAIRLSECVSRAFADDSSAYEVWERPDMQRIIVDEPWHNSVDLSAIVQAAFSIDSYSGYVLDPIPSVKGVGIQERSLCLAFYTLDVPS